MKNILLILFLLFPVISYASDWNSADSIREVSWQIINFIDYGQTLGIAKNPDKYYERNPIIGKHPSVGTVNVYMIGSAVLHPVVSYFLPKKYRQIWQYGTIITSGICVINNNSIGVGVKF